MGIKAPVARLHRGVPIIPYPSFRKGYLPTVEQAAFELSVVKAILAQEELYGASTEFVSCRGIGKGSERHCDVIRASELPLLKKEAVDHLLSKYLAGVALLLDAGLGGGRAKFSGYRIIDPDGKGLFG